MSAIVKEVYDAFLDAGASEEKATDAAKAIAGYDHSYDARFGEIDQRLDKVDARLNKIESNLLVMKWMLGLIVVVNVLPMLKTLFLS